MRRAGLAADVYFAWGESLSPVRAAVVLASIADAAGSSDAAFRLLMGAMPYHLKADLYGDPALPKHLVHDRRDADRGLSRGRGAERRHVRGRNRGADGAVGVD